MDKLNAVKMVVRIKMADGGQGTPPTVGLKSLKGSGSRVKELLLNCLSDGRKLWLR